MTEISTNEVNSVSDNDLRIAEIYCSDDFNHQDRQFYSFLSSRLNRIQRFPKVETVFKIITYSKNYEKI